MNRRIYFANCRMQSTVFARIAHYKRTWLLVAALIAVMQFSDPLGDVSLSQAAMFWVVRILCLVASLLVAEWFVANVLVGTHKWDDWVRYGVVPVLLAAVPLTGIEIWLETSVPQALAYDDEALRQASPLLAALTEYLTIVSVVLPINLAICLLLVRRDAPQQVKHLINPQFLDKTNGIDSVDVVAMMAEGHYVKVFTQDRDVLVYYRFRDAVAEMPDSLGLQVHRSWWVSRAAIKQERRGTRRVRLLLNNGLEVPVGDKYLASLRSQRVV